MVEEGVVEEGVVEEGVVVEEERWWSRMEIR